jgi:trigger factor
MSTTSTTSTTMTPETHDTIPMKIELEDLSPVKRRMSVEVPAAEVDRERGCVLRGLQKKVKMPGFRQGHVPLDVIRTRFAEEVEQELREHVLGHSFREAAQQKGLRPIGDPEVEEVSHEAGQPLRYRTTFEVLPQIELRGVQGIDVRRPSAAVTDAEVEQGLESLRRSKTRLIVKEQGAGGAAQGDVVVADIEATPAGGQTAKRERMPIELGTGENPAEFDQGILGALPGADLSFDVDYPAEHRSTELAGKRVTFKLHVYELKRPELPALDDEFARDLGPFADLGALRVRVREDLERRRHHEAERTMRQSLLDKLLLSNPVVLPDGLVERELRLRLEDFVRGLMLRGIDPQKAELDWQELRRHQEDAARKTVHAGLVLDALAARESLNVEPAEVESRIVEDARALGEPPQELRKKLQDRGALSALKHQILREKALDYLSAVANIQSSERGSVT